MSSADPSKVDTKEAGEKQPEKSAKQLEKEAKKAAEKAAKLEKLKQKQEKLAAVKPNEEKKEVSRNSAWVCLKVRYLIVLS